MEMTPRHLPQQEGQQLYIHQELLNTTDVLPADEDEAKTLHGRDMTATLPLRGVDMTAALP